MWRIHFRAIIASVLLMVSGVASAGVLDQVAYPDVNGKVHRLSEWQGKVLVVNFWATWCAPCREEMPMLNTLSQRFGPRGVAIVGVAIDQRIPVNNFARQFSITYPLLIADSAGMDWMRELGNRVSGLPFTVIFDRSGKPVARLIGRLSEEQVVAAIQAQL